MRYNVGDRVYVNYPGWEGPGTIVEDDFDNWGSYNVRCDSVRSFDGETMTGGFNPEDLRPLSSLQVNEVSTTTIKSVTVNGVEYQSVEELKDLRDRITDTIRRWEN